MSVVFIVLPLGLLLAGAAIAAFVWSARTGQLDDLDDEPGERGEPAEQPDAEERDRVLSGASPGEQPRQQEAE